MQAYRIDNALHFYERLVSLPCSVGLTEEQIAQVVAVIEKTAMTQSTHREHH